MLDRLKGLWRQYGTLGFVARVWSRTLGKLVDVDVTLTMSVPLPLAFKPISGYQYERAAFATPRFAEAAALLGVDPERRTGQEAFVAVGSDGRIAAATFNERVNGDVASHRGLEVASEHRGFSLGGNMLRFQGQELAGDGAREIHYHVAITNRASRRMLAKMGTKPIERWIFLKLAGGVRFSHCARLRKTSALAG